MSTRDFLESIRLSLTEALDEHATHEEVAEALERRVAKNGRPAWDTLGDAGRVWLWTERAARDGYPIFGDDLGHFLGCVVQGCDVCGADGAALRHGGYGPCEMPIGDPPNTRSLSVMRYPDGHMVVVEQGPRYPDIPLPEVFACYRIHERGTAKYHEALDKLSRAVGHAEMVGTDWMDYLDGARPPVTHINGGDVTPFPAPPAVLEEIPDLPPALLQSGASTDESLPLVECWSLVKPDEPYRAPETLPSFLQGKVYGRPGGEEGRFIRTSAVAEVVGGVAYTSNGSAYRLGTPNPEWVAWLDAHGLSVESFLAALTAAIPQEEQECPTPSQPATPDLSPPVSVPSLEESAGSPPALLDSSPRSLTSTPTISSREESGNTNGSPLPAPCSTITGPSNVQPSESPALTSASEASATTSTLDPDTAASAIRALGTKGIRKAPTRGRPSSCAHCSERIQGGWQYVQSGKARIHVECADEIQSRLVFAGMDVATLETKSQAFVRAAIRDAINGGRLTPVQN